ncbi:GH92 family glycosyl hydrolase [Litoribacter alkaliphilus]|uniref:GH92 family glycosyl hydrolase n=1 Tax=Litoribacter ruber TaxID=702568 RepID=A0AAP2G251_9BACT|nr:GH92 family glycosyl hydrolase [Litoribacter alkaliphilus]MBS9525634.1 GH92 family glycosyl hydrolase [Litoribacter alkaliphilus]
MIKIHDKKLFQVCMLGLVLTCACSQQEQLGEREFEDVLKYVDPDIGTAHSRWFFYTPAAVPHGMAKLAPSTNAHYGNPSGWEAVGYDTRHNSIEGFVHFHEWQIGGINLMPATGPLKVKPGKLEDPDEGYRSRFDRNNQVAEPGYYKVFLDDYGVMAELTATERVGLHRYTFPQSKESRIIFDVGNVQGESGQVKDASIAMVNDTQFEGFVTTYPKYVELFQPEGEVSMYIWGEVNKNPERIGSFNSANIYRDSVRAEGKGAGLFLEYETSDQEMIEVKVGMSYTSIENAKRNFETEADGLSFDAAKANAQQVWQEELSKVYVESSDERNKVKFYTGLFHALLGRGVANDSNGAFPQNDGSIGHISTGADGKVEYNHYNTDAIWGAFWNLTQLWALSYPERYNDYVQTQLAVFENSGWLGDGIAASKFVSGVGTNFTGLAIAAAYNSGIRDYEVDLAYSAVKGNELGWEKRNPGSGKMDIKSFLELGFVPYVDGFRTDSIGSSFSASHTLEYSFSAYAAAQMAKLLGKQEDYELFMENSRLWKNLFDSTENLIRPKLEDNTFIDPFDPYEPWRGFQEGNAMQYTFYVPHDPEGLINKIGKEKFNDRLENIFQVAQKNGFGGGEEIDAFAGIRNIYNHGNQPSLHISWLFNFSGKPWLTQKWTRAICDEFYGTEGIHGYGYGQDEDQGQLGAWYVMTSLGLFDVKGLTDARPIIQFGSPLFDKATIQLGNDRDLVLETVNNSADNVYIQSVEFNGKVLDNCWLYRDELMAGGKLIFTMSNEPNEQWGINNPPPTFN